MSVYKCYKHELYRELSYTQIKPAESLGERLMNLFHQGLRGLFLFKAPIPYIERGRKYGTY